MKKSNYKGLIFSALAAATLALGTGTTSILAVEDSQTSENSSTSQNTRQKNSAQSDSASSEKTTNKNTKDSSTNSANGSTQDSTSKNTTKDSTSKDATSKDSTSTSKNKTNTNSTSNKTTNDVNDEIAVADLTTVTDSKINLTDATTNLLIEKAGTYTLSGDTNKTVVVDTDGDVTLVLDKANFTSEKLPSIYVRNAQSTKIELKNTSTIANNGKDEILNAAVYVRSPLSFTGNGTLTITDANGHGIKAKEDMTSKSVTLNITAKEDGIHASDSLIIESGKYTITSGDDGIQANDNLTIKNGTFVIDAEGDGLHGDGDVELLDGTYTINAQSEGVESKANLLITKGAYTINATDDGLNAASSLTIKNGKLTVVSTQNDAIDSNGALTIEGGTIYATGLRAPEGAFDVDNTAFTIKGGTVVGLSATATKPTDASQNTIMINVTQSFGKLEVKQENKTVLTYNNNALSQFNNVTLTLSAKDIQADKETEIYLDGELYDSAFTTQQGLTTVGNIATMGGGRGGMMGGMTRPTPDEDFGGNYAPDGDYDDDFFYRDRDFSRDHYYRGYDDGYYDGYYGEDYGYSYRGRGHHGSYEDEYDVYFGKDGDDYYLYEEDIYIPQRPNQDSSTSNRSNSNKSNGSQEDSTTSATESTNNKKTNRNQTTNQSSNTSTTENA